LVFNAYLELGIALVAVAFLAAVRFAPLNVYARWASLAVLLAVSGAATYEGIRYHRNVTVSERGFYGVLRVKEYGTAGTESHLKRLLHGVIMHGEQHMHEPMRSRLTTYYQESSGVGAVLQSLRNRPGARVGLIGLGTGTLAAYGRKGDVYRFYDINPQVVRVAQSEFTFLRDSAARIEIALGDARLVLERESPQQFDLLAVDAFSSDAIPVHLITREALAIYRRHMKPSGIIAFHVTNRYLDLVPVVEALARDQGLHVAWVEDNGDAPLASRSDWVLLSADPKALQRGTIPEATSPVTPRPDWRLWTDDFNNLVQVLK
jgi:spermidine synthase